MGGFQSLFNFKKEKRILMLGLDGAGKTTMLYKLKLGEIQTTVPTIGFNVEKIVYKQLHLTVWDIGGQDRLRPLWRHYFNGVNALIYIIDINDGDREKESLDELANLLNNDELKSIPILIFANKMDLPNTINISELNNRCYSICKDNNYYVQPCSNKQDTGLYNGLDWLCKSI